MKNLVNEYYINRYTITLTMSLKLLTEKEIETSQFWEVSPKEIRDVQHAILSLNEYVCDDPIIHTDSDGVFRWNGKDIGWVKLPK